MAPDIKRTIGRLNAVRGDGAKSYGTAFLVDGQFILTAFHVIGDRLTSIALSRPMFYSKLFFELGGDKSNSSEAVPLDDCCDPVEDWALLRLNRPFEGIRTSPLSELSQNDATAANNTIGPQRFSSWGFPAVAAITGGGFLVDGEVADVAATYQQAPAYQLYCRHAAGRGDTLEGLSGAPCVVDNAIVGIIRTNLVDVRQDELSRHVVAGTLFACPLVTEALQSRCSRYISLAIDPIPGLPGFRKELPREPFQYLHWFDSDHSAVFFGRNGKIREIYVKATDPKAPKVLLFYGESGVGKSSLLQAGLLPRLERDFDVRASRRKASETLASIFWSVLHAPASVDAAKKQRPVVLVLDQIEEVFIAHDVDGKYEMTELVAKIQDALSLGEPPARIILSFRSEWLPQIRSRFVEANVATSEVFLERMNAAEVKEVVRGVASTQTLRSFYGVHVDQDLPDLIAADLLADPNSPISTVLSIVLTRLWEYSTRATLGARRFSSNVYRDQMRQRIDIKAFFEEQVVLVAKDRPEDAASGLIEDLLFMHTTFEGTSAQVDWKQLELNYFNASLPGRDIASLRSLIESLIRHRLIFYPKGDASSLAARSEPSAVASPNGVPFLPTRLSHDTLAVVVRRQFQSSTKPGQRARRVLEARVGGSVHHGGGNEALNESDLNTVRQGLRGMRNVSSEEDRLINESVKAQKRKKRKHLASLAVGAIAIVAIAFLGVAKTQQRKERAQYYFSQGVAATDAKEYLSAELLLANALLLDDTPSYRERLLDVRTRSPHRRSITAMPAECRLMAVSANGELAACITSGTASSRRSHILNVYNLNGSNAPVKSLPIDLKLGEDGMRGDFSAADNSIVIADLQSLQKIPLQESLPPQILPISGPISAFALCKKEGRIVIEDNEKKVWVEDFQSKEKTFVMQDKSNTAVAMAFDDSCTHISLAMSSNEVQVLSLDGSSWKQDTVFSKHRDTATAVAYGRDGEAISGSSDATIRIWNPSSGKEVSRLVGHTGDISSVAVSANGRRIISRSADQTIKVWDRDSARVLFSIREFDDLRGSVDTWSITTRGAGFIGDHDDVIFFRNGASEIEVWDLFNEREGFMLHEAGTVNTLAFHPSMPLLVSGGDDHPDSDLPPSQRKSNLRLWNLQSRQIVREYKGESSPILNTFFTADGSKLIASDTNGKVGLWDFATAQDLAEGKQLPTASWAIAYFESSVNGNSEMLTGDPSSKKIVEWDLASNAQVGSFEGDTVSTGETKESDGPSSGKKTQLLSIATRSRFADKAGQYHDVVVIGSDKVSVHELKPPSAILLKHFDIGRGVYSIAFDPKSSSFAVGSSDRYVHLYDISDLTNIVPKKKLLWHHDGTVNSVAYCSQWLVSAGEDGVVRLSDIAEENKSIAIHAHDSAAWWVTCNNAQTLVASGGSDQAIRIFNLEAVRNTLKSDPAKLLIEAEMNSGLRLASEHIVRNETIQTIQLK